MIFQDACSGSLTLKPPQQRSLLVIRGFLLIQIRYLDFSFFVVTSSLFIHLLIGSGK